MKNILIIANFTQLPSENGNNRFIYLANMIKQEANVEVITSSFSHRRKEQRQEEVCSGYKITQIYEPGYKKNISLKRFFSHFIFGKNVKKYLAKIEKPDVVYCAIPSLTAAIYAAKYAKKNKIPFVIDIQDLWPEAFKMVFKVPIIKDVIFLPFTIMANYVYKKADRIVAVSQTYIDRALRVNKHCEEILPVFLGTNINDFDSYYNADDLKKSTDEIQIAYIGTLGHSYNIKLVIDAVNVLKNKYKLKFVIMGDGPLMSDFEEYAKSLEVPCEFTGILPYSQMVKRLVGCDIALNPIKSGSAGSIINKVGDYAMAGLPVINTQECEEYRKLVQKYNIGYNSSNDSQELVEKLEILIKDVELRMNMGKNNRILAEEMFDRKLTYPNIVKLLKGNND